MQIPAVGAQYVGIGELAVGPSPRLNGIDEAHVRHLAEEAGPMPPIVVHQSTMSVIDGIHRLEAARVRGDKLIPVVYFNGSDADAFVAAVRLNVKHGRPLNSSDRAAATLRILASHSQWSDRRIAATCGVATRTVARLRSRSTDNEHQLNNRVGRDGRLRPVSAAEGRTAAVEYIRSNPQASIRDIARAAGVSVGTAMNLRRALFDAGRNSASRNGDLDARRVVPDRWAVARQQLNRLMRDPSLRYTDDGRALLRLCSMTLAYLSSEAVSSRRIPPHCGEPLRLISEACAAGWRAFADGAWSADRVSPEEMTAA